MNLNCIVQVKKEAHSTSIYSSAVTVDNHMLLENTENSVMNLSITDSVMRMTNTVRAGVRTKEPILK